MDGFFFYATIVTEIRGIMKSKIKDLLNNPMTVLVFDVDGVLAKIEYGRYNHYYYDDEAWAKALETENFYEHMQPIPVMANLIHKHDSNHIYVATKVMNEREGEQKKEFLEKQYGILPNHVYTVLTNEDKLHILNEIKKNYPNLEEYQIVMIDDTVEVLNDIMKHSSFGTVHISTFLS